MATITPDKIRKTHEELSGFLAKEEIINSFERAIKDRTLLRKAKRDTKAYLKEEGHDLPPQTEFTISEARIIVTGQIRVCIRACRKFGPYTICVEYCKTITVIVIA